MTATSQTKHTPGKLVASPYIGSEDSWFIAIDGTKLCGGGHPPLKGADADRIALTWNCHDELVAACEAVVIALSGRVHSRAAVAAVEACAAALTKAGA